MTPRIGRPRKFDEKPARYVIQLPESVAEYITGRGMTDQVRAAILATAERHKAMTGTEEVTLDEITD